MSNTCRSLCLEKRWLKRIWQASLRSQVAERMWLHSSWISNCRAENLGMNSAKRASCWGWAVELTWQLLVYFQAYSTQDHSAFAPTSRLNTLAKDPLRVPCGLQLAQTDSTGKNRNILICTYDKPSLLVQVVSAPFIALSISLDLDFKANWPAYIAMNDQGNPKGTNKTPKQAPKYFSHSLPSCHSFFHKEHGKYCLLFS